MVCAKPAKILYMHIIQQSIFVVCSACLHYDDDCPINNIDEQAEGDAVPIHLKQQIRERLLKPAPWLLSYVVHCYKLLSKLESLLVVHLFVCLARVVLQ